MGKIEKIRQEIERRLRRENGILWNAKKRGTYPSPSCEYNLLTLTSLRDFIDTLSEEPDKDLDEAADDYAVNTASYYHEDEDDEVHSNIDELKPAFIAGAKWMQDQFEKNRLAHCDKLTKEEYDRETDFALEIVENERRQPTFTDAINYGMRVMKEYLMKEAVEGFYTKSIDGDVVFAESTALDVDPKSVKVGDKVKLIVIKED